jgi:hypothetical protein
MQPVLLMLSQQQEVHLMLLEFWQQLLTWSKMVSSAHATTSTDAVSTGGASDAGVQATAADLELSWSKMVSSNTHPLVLILSQQEVHLTLLLKQELLSRRCIYCYLLQATAADLA